jgi:hypothetical protein
MANINHFAADESDVGVSSRSSPFLSIPKPTSFTSNNPYNLQTIYPPTVPQSTFRLPLPGQTVPDLAQTLRDAGLTHTANLLEETKSEHKTEYDLQALMKAVLVDNGPGSTTSAAWELFRVMDGAIRKVLHTRKALREANRTFDVDCDNLRADNHVLHNQIASLRERLTDSQLACATALASQTRAATTKSLAKDPTAFDASEKDAIKRNTEYENWRSKILIRWAQDSHEFTDELKKVLHIASLLTGSAWQSVQKGVTTILDNPTDQGKWTWAAGTDLLAALDRTYRNFDVAAEADKRLTLLSQKDEYSVFTDFITEFVTLCDRAEIDDATRVRYLREKINARIRKATVMQNPQPDRADWPGWLKLVSSLAKNIEHDEFQAKAHQHHGNKHNNNNGPSTSNNNNAPPKRDPDAMDLSTARVGRVSPAEMQYRLDNGLCKRCGGQGHIAINCTPADRAAAPSNRGGAQAGRGAPRGGGRDVPRGGFAGYRGRGGYPSTNPYNGAGRGYAPPPQYNNNQQYPHQYGYAPRLPQYGPHVRGMTTDDTENYDYYAAPYTYPHGFVEGEVQDDAAAEDHQGKENPPR